MGLYHLASELYQMGINNGTPKIIIIITYIVIVSLGFIFFKALLGSAWHIISDYDRSTDEKIVRWNKSAKIFGVCIIILVVILVVIPAYYSSSDGEDTNPNYSHKKTSSYSDEAKAVSNAMDYRSSAVRNAAVSMIDSDNSGSYNIGQICDVFSYSRSHWVYVSDPAGGDYYAPASTSVNLMRGDCDDFAIMMTSLMNAIGGFAHYVSVKNAEGKGHAYAEVLLGTDYNSINDLIDDISSYYGGEYIHYSTFERSDGTTEYWLNLDWQENHAGGKYYESVGEAFIVDSSGNYKITTRNF